MNQAKTEKQTIQIESKQSRAVVRMTKLPKIELVSFEGGYNLLGPKNDKYRAVRSGAIGKW